MEEEKREEYKKEEYKMLKDEINKLRSSQTTLSTFAITAVIAVLGFSNNVADSSITYLFPMFLLLPISLKVMSMRLNVFNIAAYMIVFLENATGYRWESYTYGVAEDEFNQQSFWSRVKRSISYFIIPIMGVINMLYYWMRFVGFKRGEDFFDLLNNKS